MKNLYKIRLGLATVIFITAIVGAAGYFYPLNVFDLQFAPALQKNIVNISVVSVFIIIFIIALTSTFGRLYCSLLCPLGILQETICGLTKKKYKKTKNLPLKYLYAIPALGALLFGSAIVIRPIEPYTVFASAFSLSAACLIIISIILVICFFKGRFFCTNICPVGAILGLISQCATFKIKIDKTSCISCGNCERHCQAECIDSKEKYIDNETCIKCLKCLNACPKNAIHYSNKQENENKKFSPERRKLLIAGIAAIILGATEKAGVNLIKTTKKIKNIILPPGAENPETFLSECFNCNLCVQHCSEKIIQKSDKDFAAPHIKYGDFGHCKFDCHKCGDVCPTGAIKKLSLETKQKTRIAMAVIKKEKCINCGVCTLKCPKKTISKTQDGYEINGINCIGCGVCAAACPGNAIEIFAIKEQKVI